MGYPNFEAHQNQSSKSMREIQTIPREKNTT